MYNPVSLLCNAKNRKTQPIIPLCLSLSTNHLRGEEDHDNVVHQGFIGGNTLISTSSNRRISSHFSFLSQFFQKQLFELTNMCTYLPQPSRDPATESCDLVLAGWYKWNKLYCNWVTQTYPTIILISIESV